MDLDRVLQGPARGLLMPLIPVGLLEEILHMINLAIEANMKDPTATAKWVAFFWITWPLAKPFLTPEQEQQIEALVKAIKVEAI